MTSKQQSLEGQIQVLKDLRSSFQSLRQIPQFLLSDPTINPIPFSSPTFTSEFQRVKNLGDQVRSDPIQDALRSARDSFKADPSNLNFKNPRQEPRRRKRREPSPESPRPYVAVEAKKSPSFLPPPDPQQGPPLRLNEISDYIRKFNAENKSKLHIWKHRSTPLSSSSLSSTDNAPVILRFKIPDVLTVYLNLGIDETRMVAESVACFGPREKKAPHTQSEYLVYQNLSQQLSKVLEAEPFASVQQVVRLLCSYENLFIDRCSRCERVVSAEGHVPGVVRIWTEGEAEPKVKHIGCV